MLHKLPGDGLKILEAESDHSQFRAIVGGREHVCLPDPVMP